MIELTNIYKRYATNLGAGPWVLQDLSLVIPDKTSVGLIGRNGAGKSTLLRILGGVDKPNRGQIKKNCRISWPMGSGGGLKGSLSGKQNAKFISRIFVEDDQIHDKLRFIEDFAGIGPAFNQPVNTYSSGMRSRLLFGMSLAFDFDVYISDEVTSAGDSNFRMKAQKAFNELANKASLIMVSHSIVTLKNFCQAGIWLHQGQAFWFDKLDDAWYAYQNSV